MSGNPALRPETFDEFRDTPLQTCLRCGATLTYPLYAVLGGRPRLYCGDACRRAGCRLRNKHGDRWWARQPWYPEWNAARDQWLAEKRQVRRQREDAARLRAAMPVNIRSGYDKADHDAFMRGIHLATVRMDIEKYSLKHSAVLASSGAEVRVVSRAERKIESLLLAAVQAASEAEAAAMFAKAREMFAAGVQLSKAEGAKADLLAWFGAS